MPFLIPESFAPRYIAFAPRGMRGWIDRAFYDSLGAAERADPLRLLAAPGARVVKDGRNLLVRAELPIGGAARTVWIKRFRPVGPIGWAARSNAKPGRSGVEGWVVQARSDWSTRHLEFQAGEIAALLFDELAAALGGMRTLRRR